MGRSLRHLWRLVALLAFAVTFDDAVPSQQDTWAEPRAAMVRTIQTHAAFLPEAAGTDPAALAAISEIERAVLDFPRGTDELRWLAETRPGYVFARRGRPVGFAFLAKGAAGPIAALDDADIPAILGHVEALAATAGSDPLELEVPGINATSIRHLLERGFHIDPWINLLMSNRPFGRFDRFIGFSPPIFL